MHVMVINLGFPASPEIALIETMLSLGIKVSVVGFELSNLPEQIKQSDSVELYDFGFRPRNFRKVAVDIEVRHRLHEILDNSRKGIDLVWTINDIAVRECGNRLLDFKHIMQLYELFEYVPIIGRLKQMPFHSESCINIARSAYKVVVPEYNRACIQQVWWGLPSLPTVLPNKPNLENGPSPDALNRAKEAFKNEDRKVILYQGIFSPERDLRPFARSMNYLNDEFVFCLLGRANTEGEKREIDEILHESDNVRYLGYEITPNHLAYTRYSRIGVLAYVPTRVGNVSPLNGLYCAPNKIWEYAHAGVPMLANNLPGLNDIFSRNNIGKCVELEPESIASAIHLIDAEHDDMGSNAICYYNSIDTTQIIKSILGL